MFMLPHVNNLPELFYLLTDSKLKLSLQKDAIVFSTFRAAQQCLAFTKLDLNSGQKSLHVPWPLRRAFQLFLDIYRPSRSILAI